MKVNVQWAITDEDRQEAFLLLKKVYLEEFDLDFELFRQAFPLMFRSDVMMIRDQDGRLVGTASMMYPLNGLFPAEYIFGAKISESTGRQANRTIEVGRLAKVPDFPGGIITKEVMLATAAYLKKENLQSWIATVKPPLYRILRSTGLQMTYFEVNAGLEGEQAEIVRRYKGDHIVVFEASTKNTIAAFDGGRGRKVILAFTG
jgi:hypothetical protein